MNLLFYVLNTSYQSLKNNYSIKIKIYFSIISYLFIISFYILSIFSIFFLFTQFGRKIFFWKTIVAWRTLQALRATAQSDCWFFPSSYFFPPFPLLAIVLQLAPRAPLYFIVVNACKLRSQCRARVSILTELIRVQSLFFARHKKPSIRGRHRFAPLRTISGSYERLRTSPISPRRAAPIASCVSMGSEIPFENWTVGRRYNIGNRSFYW